MASGYGLTGGPGRCFPFWQELLACYVVNTNADDNSGKAKCAPVLEDYYECLHHKKETNADVLQAARTRALQVAYRKAEASAAGGESAPTSGQIRNLGLLNKEEDTKKVLEKS
ncbi:NADH:ubiquinone oxidoreductase subunit [Apiospora rasikravindrae]|uniref:NADH dehydrogenase [ubiquinone] iron-sulfur protein 5 n=1 Tax=Apiospora rasikravindrae TaxID=990691 RepID=A0ABR1SLU7_9PEZI